MDNLTDVEDIVLMWLKGWLPVEWKPYTDKPKTPPEKFILIDRTGGPREAMVLDRAEILIEVYHKQGNSTAQDNPKRAARNMAQLIADKIRELETVHNIATASVNSMVRLDDTLTQSYRYQVYCDIDHRR